jgi:hypothetical protein
VQDKTMRRPKLSPVMSIAAILLFISQPMATAQVAVSLAPLAKQQFFSASGIPLASGCLFTYVSGTSTPLATYTDGTGTASNTNPLILDSGGFASLWLSNSSYRFQLFSAGGVNCASGTLQYTVDNVSSYTVINQAQNIFLAGASSDPGGSAGELGYRTDIPCFRGFTTFWDCFVRLTDAQSLSNKTIDVQTNTIVNDSANLAGHYLRNNGTKFVDSPLNMSDGVTVYTNSGAIAPVLNEIAKFAGSATVAQTTDTAGFIGICVNNCSLGSQGQYQSSGIGSCIFDGGTTVNDYVQNSTTNTGNCHDTGVSPPASPGAGQIIGRVLSTNAIAGTYTLELFPPEIRQNAGASITLTAVNLTGQIANVAATTIVTPAANGFYRISCYIVETVAAATTSTLPACQFNYTDADSATIENPIPITTSNAGNTVGLVGQTVGAGNPNYFYAQAGVPIKYFTTAYASNPVSTMTYSVRIRLEGPF